ncbi:MAG: orotidine-5'-phosphate decarboxylase [Oligoflexia bacterium]|nr:orotidine-5'-phosphate decarboxylase [Oligoflexia bacterium]
MNNPIIVALDLDDVEKARKLTEKLAPYVGGFKFGPRLTLRCERSFLKELSSQAILFIDHKFFDIPSTTVANVKVAAELGAHWVTVHALNGPHCLQELAALEIEIRKTKKDFRILAVTVLTSFSKETLPPIWKDQSISQSVIDLAKSVHQQGLHSLVCSAEEIEVLKKQNQDTFLVVPGIRPEGSASNDQNRMATPIQALKRGASALVIGRPIIDDKDPIEAAKRIFESIQNHTVQKAADR